LNWFEKFLDEKALTRHEVYVEGLHNRQEDNEKKVTHIAVWDLGEWALKEWKNRSDCFEDEKGMFFEYFSMNKQEKKEYLEEIEGELQSGDYPLCLIALACLGEKEVRKRLEGLV